MKRLFKWLGIILALIIFILVVLFAIAFSLTRPSKLKPLISKQVYEATGRTLALNGDLHWSISPLGFQVDNLVLSNAAGFKNPIFMSVGHANLHIKFFPLLKGKIEATNLTLDNLNINLEKNAQGQVNWDFSKQKTTAQSTSAASQSNPASNKSVPPSNKTTDWQFSAPAVNVNNVNLTYLDDKSQQYISINHLNFSAKNIVPNQAFPINLSLSIQNQEPQLNANINLNAMLDFNLKQNVYSLNDLNLATKINNNFLNQANIAANLNGSFTVSPSNLALTINQFTLDNTHATGFAKINDFNHPVINFGLNADQFNLDNYLPKNTSSPQKNITTSISNTPTTSSNNTMPATAKPMDLSALRNLSLNGSINLGKLTAMKANLSKLVVETNVNQGVLRINPIQANLYQGSFKGQATINASQAITQFSASGNLNNIQAQGLLNDMYHFNKLSGTGNLQFNITTSGNNSAQLTQNLNGSAQTSLSNVSLKGIDIGYYVQSLNALINKQAMPKQSGANTTEFGNLNAAAIIKQGVITTQQLNMSSPIMQVSGNMTANLVQQTLSGLLNIVPTTGSMENAQKTPVTLPLKISGTFNNVSITPQYQQAAVQSAQNYLVDQVSKSLPKGINLDALKHQVTGQ